MRTDLRPMVLERLGAPTLDKLETIEESWENAYGPERDAMEAAVTIEHWQACTDQDDVLKIIKPFPVHSKRLIALLFAESCAHLTNDPHPAMVRRMVWISLNGRLTTKELTEARSRPDKSAYSPACEASWYAGFGDPHAAVRVSADSAALAAADAGRFTSVHDAMIKLLGPDGPLKALVESPQYNTLQLLLTRWEVALECAHRVFK